MLLNTSYLNCIFIFFVLKHFTTINKLIFIAL